MAANMNLANGPYIVIPQNTLPTVLPAPVQAAQGQKPRSYQEFLKGHPKALGTMQIMVALLYVSLGTVLLFTLDSYVSFGTYSGISYWGAAFYIISGSLSIAAGHKRSSCEVQGALAMNIISSLVSLAAIGLYCADIAHHIHNYNPPCYDLCGIYHDEVFILRELALGFLVLCSLLEFCVSVSLSVFGGRSLQNHSTLPQVIVISNDYQNPAAISVGNLNQNQPRKGEYTMPEGSLVYPGMNAASPQPNYIPSNPNMNPVYPALSG